MAETVAIAIQRGGVGKSFVTYALATDAAARGEPVLIVDLDPQVSLSEMLGIQTTKTEETFDTLLTRAASAKEVQPIEPLVISENLCVLPGSIDMAVTEGYLASLRFGRETCVRRALLPYQEHFRWIFIDCSPSLGILTVNALSAVRKLVVPIGTDFVSVRALRKFLSFAYEAVKQELNPELELVGILPNKVDIRRSEDTSCLEEIQREYQDKFHIFPAARNLSGYSRAAAQRVPIRSDKDLDVQWLDAIWDRLQGGDHGTRAAK